MINCGKNTLTIINIVTIAFYKSPILQMTASFMVMNSIDLDDGE